MKINNRELHFGVYLTEVQKDSCLLPRIADSIARLSLGLGGAA